MSCLKMRNKFRTYPLRVIKSRVHADCRLNLKACNHAAGAVWRRLGHIVLPCDNRVLARRAE